MNIFGIVLVALLIISTTFGISPSYTKTESLEDAEFAVVEHDLRSLQLENYKKDKIRKFTGEVSREPGREIIYIAGDGSGSLLFIYSREHKKLLSYKVLPSVKKIGLKNIIFDYQKELVLDCEIKHEQGLEKRKIIYKFADAEMKEIFNVAYLKSNENITEEKEIIFEWNDNSYKIVSVDKDEDITAKDILLKDKRFDKKIFHWDENEFTYIDLKTL